MAARIERASVIPGVNALVYNKIRMRSSELELSPAVSYRLLCGLAYSLCFTWVFLRRYMGSQTPSTSRWLGDLPQHSPEEHRSSVILALSTILLTYRTI